MSATLYDVDYFVRKFEAIPDRKWCMNAFRNAGRCCALGHCGMTPKNNDEGNGPEEAQALGGLFKTNGLYVDSVNDFRSDRYPQTTPKARILAALRDIKEKAVA